MAKTTTKKGVEPAFDKKMAGLPCLLVLCNIPLAILFFIYWKKNPDVYKRSPDASCIQSALKNEAITGVPGICPQLPPYFCVFNKKHGVTIATHQYRARPYDSEVSKSFLKWFMNGFITSAIIISAGFVGVVGA